MSRTPELPSTSKADVAVDAETRALLDPQDLQRLYYCADTLLFSFQQLKLFSQWLIDCRMWHEFSFWENMQQYLQIESLKTEGLNSSEPLLNAKQIGERFFKAMQKNYNDIAGKAKAYPEASEKEKLPHHTFIEKTLQGQIFKLCPAASEKAVCCNLKVLNIVDNCAMACSYCVLQNHYDEATVAIPVNLAAKLAEVPILPHKRYRIGTGEYSDSLLWGNKNNILRDLCDFAERHPNIVLELKTKSANVAWLLENDIPKNVCCTWSLNPPIIIANEEHKTASLERRLEAARAVADKGIKVGFHFHPMFYFESYEKAYTDLMQLVQSRFAPEETLWVSLGCITMLKGFAQDFRKKFQHSKLLQMQTEFTADGKITYAFAVREKLYRNALNALEPWRGKVFQYLCMEHKPMWDAVMGYDYPNMAVFDDAFNEDVFAKL